MKLNSNNNIEQLAEWIDEWQEQLFRYAFYRVGNRSDAEDVVQDALLKIASTTTPISNPKAYLFRIVANGCVDSLRQKSLLQPLQERIPATSYSEEMEAQEEFKRIERLLSRLPEQQSEVIRLHIHAGLKFTEIAETLEQPVTTIKSRFASGIEKLKQQFIN
ncbi:MAG: RNA polymerase sigma factor [Alistipes sp.]|nr:RNA polymerase sigma factor [Alistipes sp.]